MSAYTVSKETIDRIVSNIRYERESTYNAIKAEFPELDHEPDMLGQKLWTMNYNAVDQRYEENTPVPLYKFNPMNGSKLQIIKSLRCLLYQCSEGNVPNTPLFKTLDAYADAKAWEYINNLPEYDQAVWG